MSACPPKQRRESGRYRTSEKGQEPTLGARLSLSLMRYEMAIAFVR